MMDNFFSSNTVLSIPNLLRGMLFHCARFLSRSLNFFPSIFLENPEIALTGASSGSRGVEEGLSPKERSGLQKQLRDVHYADGSGKKECRVQ